MKKVNFKSILMALAVTLTFLFAGMERVNAQGLSDGIFSVPTGSFVNSDQAQQKLMAQMTQDRSQIDILGLIPGTPTYNAYYSRAMYYNHMNLMIRDNGTAVSTAIAEALQIITHDEYSFNLTKYQLQQLKSDAIAYLQN